MDFIIEFYKNLDIVNLIIFWGVIVVVLLLLFFSILMTNKNKKLQRIIESKGIIVDDYNDSDIPTLKNNHYDINNEREVNINQFKPIKKSINGNEELNNETKLKNNTTLLDNDEKVDKELPKDEFVVEEHIIDYKKANDNITKEKIAVDIAKNESKVFHKAYQKNILKEMSLNQTSPIGIIKKDINKKEEDNAAELYNCFNDFIEKKKDSKIVNIIENNNNIISSENKNKSNYLEELAKTASSVNESISRTTYELKQEEEAIISYEELMRKKDKIQIVDEEEAIISIDELINKSQKKEKLYNINNTEDNEQFIDELKNFRSDL